MVVYENDCVGCPPEMGCMGKSCPYINVPTYYCDVCNTEVAEYKIEDYDLCEDCAEQYLKDEFNNLTFWGKADVLDIELKVIN